jgi:DNA processing protein
LIKQGAKVVQDWNDVVVELPTESRRHLIEKGRIKAGLGVSESTPGEQASLLNGSGPAVEGAARKALEALQVDAATHLDNLLEKLPDTSASEVIAALFELEMLGLVKQLPGKNFVKVW